MFNHNEPITFACVTRPHLDRLQNLLPKVLPYVDRVVLVIGEKDGPTIQWLRTINQEKKIEAYYYKWHDNFADSWNAYLAKINTGWCMICDDDEIPSESMLKSLDKYINESEHGERYCCVEFRCNPISEGQDMGACNYWRQIFFRYNPGMTYRGGVKTGCHQYLVGYQNNRVIRSDYVYYHVKSLRDEYRNAARNYFIYGIWLHGSADGDQREEWYELKDVLRKAYPQVESFPDLDRLLVAGGVDKSLTDWMQKWHTNLKEGSEYLKQHPEYNYSDYNETRAIVSYYFKFLHPEEKPAGMEL